MKDNTKREMTVDDAATFAVNAFAETAVRLQREGVPSPLILYALDVNHAMALKVVVDGSFAAMKAEQSEGPKGG